jgi:hypothetical protein
MQLGAFKRGFWFGVGMTIGMTSSVLLAVTVSGTVNSFSRGEVISATTINENFSSLRSAIEGIPAITENGNAGSGYVTIGTKIIQWGSSTCDPAGINVNFPTSFSHSSYRLLLSTENQFDAQPRYDTRTTTGFICQTSAGTPNTHYIAIGE